MRNVKNCQNLLMTVEWNLRAEVDGEKEEILASRSMEDKVHLEAILVQVASHQIKDMVAKLLVIGVIKGATITMMKVVKVVITEVGLGQIGEVMENKRLTLSQSLLMEFLEETVANQNLHLLILLLTVIPHSQHQIITKANQHHPTKILIVYSM